MTHQKTTIVPQQVPSMLPSSEAPVRVQLLHSAADLTGGDRQRAYGHPSINLACAAELKTVLRKWQTRPMPNGEQEAIEMVLTKLSRIATGTVREDNYIDGAAYFAIAGEIALSGQTDGTD